MRGSWAATSRRRRRGRRSVRAALWVLGIGIALGGLAPRAHAYGMATHAWLSDEAARRIAQTDPALSFLQADPYAHACFRYGAIFPDVRSIGSQASALGSLKRKLESMPFVTSVGFSTAGVGTAFRAFGTHDSRFALALVAAARASGDRYQLAFALGNLAHIVEDKHSQTLCVPCLAQDREVGDLGVEPTADPSRAAHWYPGYENELVVEALGDLARPREAILFARDAPYRLHANETISHNRAIDLRRFYHSVAAQLVRAHGGTPPSERALLNAAQLYEVAASFYPIATGSVTLAETLRVVLLRHVRLAWWAQLTTGLIDGVTQNLTQAQSLVELVEPLIPLPLVGRQIGARSPLIEMMFAVGAGGATLQGVRARYAANVEFQRLDRSGLLDPQTYASFDYEPCQVMTVDALVRGALSPFTDDTRWPVYSRVVMRAAAMRSLLRLQGPGAAANAPGLLVFSVGYRDPLSAATWTEVSLPGDVGRTLRAEVELAGTTLDPEPRLVRLRLRADTGAGAGDPVLAEASRLVPARSLSIATYVAEPRPSVSVEWTVADVAGARGVYLEVDELRVTPTPGPGEADPLLTTRLETLAPQMGGRPHYAAHYRVYQDPLTGLRLRR